MCNLRSGGCQTEMCCRAGYRNIRRLPPPNVTLSRNNSVGISDSPSPGLETTRGRPLPRAGEAGSPSSPASPHPTGGEAGRAPARSGEGDFIPSTAVVRLRLRFVFRLGEESGTGGTPLPLFKKQALRDFPSIFSGLFLTDKRR